MKDTIIKGSGNSMSIRSVPNLASLAPTYEDFLRLLSSDENGLPIDLGPLNPAGCDTVGDALNKANLLKDATAALYGKTAEATPDEILAAIYPLIASAQNAANAKGNCFVETGAYAGTGSTWASNRLIQFNFIPYVVFICVFNDSTPTTHPFYLLCSRAGFGLMVYHGGSVARTDITWDAHSVIIPGYMNFIGDTYYYVGITV